MNGEPGVEQVVARLVRGQALARLLARAALGALIGLLAIVLLYQIPAYHRINIGAYDTAYVQGFYDPEAANSALLAGSDGSVRWSGERSALLLPQVGLPAELSLRLRSARTGKPPPEVDVYLNGTQLLGRFSAGADWSERQFTINAGLLKASDIFIELRVEPDELPDGRMVGVLLDQASLRTGRWPIMPYPAQLLYGLIVGACLGLLGSEATARSRMMILVAAIGLALAFLGLYRLQPPLYPYPLRWLPPAMALILSGLAAVRFAPELAHSRPWLGRIIAPGAMILLWLGAIGLAAREHMTLSRPGVENDFRVFATRESLTQIFQADGFYNLGYSLLLWLVRPFSLDNAFLAGRLVAAFSGAALLLAAYMLARRLLDPAGGLLALLTLSLSGMISRYGLYVGSDMPFAACLAWCVALLVIATTNHRVQQQVEQFGYRPRILALLCLAGLAGGCAFLMRHLGLLLLPWGLFHLALLGGRPWRRAAAGAGIFTIGFALAAAPQLAVNTIQTGNPLYNQQAKNVWLAVYADTDWERWAEAPDSIALNEVILRDPARFLANWRYNLTAFFGTGAEDTSEFGQAIQLRLLGFPANWLAVIGLVGMGLSGLGYIIHRRNIGSLQPQNHERPTMERQSLSMIVLIMLYVLASSMAFILPRFLLPLAPVYALGAAWLVMQGSAGARTRLAIGLLLVVVLWDGFRAGTGYVLANQPADELAAARLVDDRLAPGERLATHLSDRVPLAKYSAIAHLVVSWPGARGGSPVTANDLTAARSAGANYLLWDEGFGQPPLPADDRVGQAGSYSLYQLRP